MKNKIIMVATFIVISIIGLSACNDSSSGDTTNKNQFEPDNKSKSTVVFSQTNEPSNERTAKADDTVSATLSENSNSNMGNMEAKETLSKYSAAKIEYARVWLQLGPNQDIDELNVHHIPAGTPLNPDDDTSSNYPEDVIQLAGSRLVDGSVTYSGNGDGTINVYNVPLRWDGSYPAGEKFYTDIINNTKQVSIKPGDDEEILKFIKLLNVHQ